MPFGAFVRVADGIEGLVHISELSSKHIDLAEQIVSVDQDVFVKVIDIDLERRRISLSLKQASEEVDPEGTDFNPALYGMAADYDENGQYRYPEGFDSATNEWKPGYETARAAWEKEYAEAMTRWETHKAQIKAARAIEASLPDEPAESAQGATDDSSKPAKASKGTLAEDESLTALRDKLKSAE